MVNVEEPQQTSSKPFIDLWQCTIAPLYRVVAHNARLSIALTWSILVAGDRTELDFW